MPTAIPKSATCRAALSRFLLGLGDGDGRSESFGMEAAGVLLQHVGAAAHFVQWSNEYEADEVARLHAPPSSAAAAAGAEVPDLFPQARRRQGRHRGTDHPGSADGIATLDSLQARYERSAVARRLALG